MSEQSDRIGRLQRWTVVVQALTLILLMTTVAVLAVKA